MKLVLKAGGMSWDSSELHAPISDGAASACPSKVTPALALALGALLHDFKAPGTTQKLFSTKRELWLKSHVAFLYPAPQEMKFCNPPEPKHASASVCRATQIPSS